jgi:hypothetical protein
MPSNNPWEWAQNVQPQTTKGKESRMFKGSVWLRSGAERGRAVQLLRMFGSRAKEQSHPREGIFHPYLEQLGFTKIIEPSGSYFASSKRSVLTLLVLHSPSPTAIQGADSVHPPVMLLDCDREDGGGTPSVPSTASCPPSPSSSMCSASLR